jgi:hypothetical protein
MCKKYKSSQARKAVESLNPRLRKYDCSTSPASKISQKKINVTIKTHGACSNNTHLPQENTDI